jgi:putative aminopeptidase FrvX
MKANLHKLKYMPTAQLVKALAATEAFVGSSSESARILREELARRQDATKRHRRGNSAAKVNRQKGADRA